MSGFRGVMKDGWHPKGKDGSSKESWRGDFKGINQVAGWMGKGKDSSKDDQAEHVSRPLSSLKDPASFGPPPKRGDSRTSATSLSRPTPAPRGLAREEITHEPEQLEEQEQGPPPPPVPYRANRTGLNTEHLPPPPVRRTESPANNTPTPASHPRPNLPPRLPTRNTNTTSPSPPPPPYSEADQSIGMNQGSISRLEQAGVSVPALGIGRRDSDQSATAQRGMNNQVNELQARFAKMSTPGSQTPQSPVEQPTSQRGFDNSTSPALRTDTRSAAPLPPTSNFRQRSNEHIETGKQKLTAFNQKHQITKRIGSFFEEQPALRASQGAPQPPPPPPHPNLSRQGSNIDIEVLNKRKPPPPPPPAKKPNLKSTPVNGGGESPSPPPLPLGTKPR